MSSPGVCAVFACEELPTHTRTFTVRADWYGEIEVEAHFCCRHMDGVEAFNPTVDLEITGRERS